MRLPSPAPSQFNPTQKKFHDKIRAGVGAMTAFKRLPGPMRQLVIIAARAHFSAAYKLDAHSTVAETCHGMSP